MMGRYRHHMYGYGSQKLIDDVIEKMELKGDEIVADLGAGVGRFTIPIAKRLINGKVYAIDIDIASLEELKKNAEEEGLKNIEIINADISEKIPLEDKSIDKILLANVFHDIYYEKREKGLLKEIKRIIKDNGKVYFVEFKKDEIYPPGPPIFMRISYEELEKILKENGFKVRNLGDVGMYHYIAEASL